MGTHLLELDEIFRRYAWNQLLLKSNFFRRLFLDEEDYICEVGWSYLTIEHKLAKFQRKDKPGQTIETNFGNVDVGSRWVPLWSSDFDNKADQKQSHNFQGSRDTTVWVDATLSQGYTINQEISIDVNIPPNLSTVRAGRDNSLKLNKLKGQVFKEVITWEANSQVEIQPGWRAKATLLAKQECASMEYEIRTTLYSPWGVVPVYFKRKSDNKLAFLVELEDFNEAFKLDSEGGVLTADEKAMVEIMFQKTWDVHGEVETSKCFTQLVTKGSCVCLTWSDQKVDIRTSPLSVEEIGLTVDGNVSTLEEDGQTHIKLSQKEIIVNAVKGGVNTITAGNGV